MRSAEIRKMGGDHSGLPPDILPRPPTGKSFSDPKPISRPAEPVFRLALPHGQSVFLCPRHPHHVFRCSRPWFPPPLRPQPRRPNVDNIFFLQTRHYKKAHHQDIDGGPASSFVDLPVVGRLCSFLVDPFVFRPFFALGRALPLLRLFAHACPCGPPVPRRAVPGVPRLCRPAGCPCGLALCRGCPLCRLRRLCPRAVPAVSPVPRAVGAPGWPRRSCGAAPPRPPTIWADRPQVGREEHAPRSPCPAAGRRCAPFGAPLG